MPCFAHVQLPVGAACPGCGAALADDARVLGFQWGYCPARVPLPHWYYAPGAALRWRVGDDGAVPAWMYFPGPLGGGNLGDPAVRDVIVLASWADDARCACGARLAIEIRDARVRGLTIAPTSAEIAVREGDAWVARPAWDDAPMDLRPARSRAFVDGDGRPVPEPGR